VIDTMVFAYALLRVENQHEQAISALETAEQIIVPDSLFAELGNVVWQWIQFRQLPMQIGLEGIN
jgi:predicted nucleic acid-binding protein